MLNRKLVYQRFFTSGFMLLFVNVLLATPMRYSDSLPASRDSNLFTIRFDENFFQLIGVPAGQYGNVPSIPANFVRDAFVTKYIATNTLNLEKIKARSDRFFSVMDTVFTRYELPLQLKYLAVIESELKTTALSKVGARGTWQLMPSTARILNLRVTEGYDERTHLYKSTVAAARYLRDLYGLFDDWLLTVAAYNCGPGPVYKAIRKSGSRNFWKLQHLLPAETRGHVKKFIATHYYFEGTGGVTTLTKTERIKYNSIMQEYVASQNILLQGIQEKQKEVPSTPMQEKEEFIVRGNAEMHLGSEQQQGLKTIVDE